jgi:hypothetical protein
MRLETFPKAMLPLDAGFIWLLKLNKNVVAIGEHR